MFLDPDGYVIVRVDLGGIAVNVNDLLASVGIDPLRRIHLQIVTHTHDHVGEVKAEVDIVMTHEAKRAEGVSLYRREAFPMNVVATGMPNHQNRTRASLAPLRAAPCPARTTGNVALFNTSAPRLTWLPDGAIS